MLRRSFASFVAVALLALVLASALPFAAARAAAGGGTLTITFQSDIPSLDPALGYDIESWPAQQALYNGLLTYASHSTALVPDLAAAPPTISADARTFTFRLRKGVRFSNGRELNAGDVQYTFTRLIDPATASPYQSWYTGIRGADAFIKHKTKSVAGIQALDPYTVRFQLSTPNVAFLYAIALPSGYIVPREAVARWGKHFSDHPLGSGPFALQSWTHGQQAVFTRNPIYFKPGLPRLQQVVFLLGVNPSTALLKLQKGEVDLLGDGLPSSDYLRVVRDPAWQPYVVRQTIVSTNYLAMNVGIKPFNNVLVRRAVEMAVNKKRLVKLINGRGVVAGSIFPPLLPGYNVHLRSYTYDPAAARALLARAGYGSGFSTELYSDQIDPNLKLDQAIQADLADVGIKVTVRALPFNTFLGQVQKPRTAALVQSYWAQDFPDPSDFVGPEFTTASQGGWNVMWYSDPAIDAQATRALGMTNSAARLAAYDKMEQTLMAEALWVPLYHQVEVDVHSPKLRGYYIHPVWGLGTVSVRLEEFSKAP